MEDDAGASGLLVLTLDSVIENVMELRIFFAATAAALSLLFLLFTPSLSKTGVAKIEIGIEPEPRVAADGRVIDSQTTWPFLTSEMSNFEAETTFCFFADEQVRSMEKMILHAKK